MDTLVFDIETQNFFTDPGVGWDNFAALKISVVCVYSYDQDKYFSFEESEMEALAELFHTAKRIVGFSMNRYDVPVLNLYFQKLRGSIPNIWGKERVDLLEEIESATGARISLSRLAEANLGIKKEMIFLSSLYTFSYYCIISERLPNYQHFYKHHLLPTHHSMLLRLMRMMGYLQCLSDLHRFHQS